MKKHTYFENMETSTFGSLLKFLRNRALRSQQSFAEDVGCHSQTVWCWEADKYPPEPKMLDAICRVLKLDATDTKMLTDTYLSDQAARTASKWSSKTVTPIKLLNAAPFAVKAPLLCNKDTTNPTTLSGKIKWQGDSVWRPQELEDRAIAAFLMPDDAMTPKFQFGDYLFFDLKMAKPHKNKAYVFCTKDGTFCRLLENWHPSYIFKAVNAEKSLMSMRREEIKWCYQVVWRASRVD